MGESRTPGARGVPGAAAGDGPREPGTGNLQTFTPPTPVATDSVYIGNLYFTDGDPVPAPSFAAPTAVDIGFTPDDEADLSILPFGADSGAVPTATVKTSPNGDRALEVVKTTGAAEGAGVEIAYPSALGHYSLLSNEHTEALVNVYAPAAVRP